jgi:lipopolysaccharide transport system ATP-binding protein
VGSLLEVGTGFHPELTGRENIYLNAAILGMKRVEISRKFDEIVAFAEIEKFLDTPVKHYSSGMYVRLAFAVAAHLDPDILLVDEVLAVGDAAFQKKCLGKMGDVAQEGRTVLFVSHNMQAVSTLTNQSFLLFEGRCIYNGPTDKTIAQYIHSISNDNLIYLAQPSSSIPTVTKVELLTSSPNNIQLNGGPMQVVFKINLPRVIKGGRFSFQIFNSLQQPIMHLPVVDGELPLFHEPGEYQLKCQIPKVRLYVGNYTLTVHFGGPKGGEKFETIQDICPFEVVTTKELHDGFWQPGTCAYVEEYEWSLTRI